MNPKPILISVAVIFVLVFGFFTYRSTWPRGEALEAALSPAIKQNESAEKAIVAEAILMNYRETRTNASRWSGVYWGFNFLAATFSALAGVILKFESLLKNREELRRDIAAFLSVAAALLVTISTSGDFSRKWQANRLAAAELERLGYEFLGMEAGTYGPILARVGDVLLQRHVSIVGAATSSPQKHSMDTNSVAH